MKDNSKRKIYTLLLLVLIPLVISIFLRLFLNVSFLTSLTVCYGVLLFFLIPSDVFSRSSLDYNIKSINPTYKQDQPNFKNTNNSELINFIVIALAFVGCLILLLINY